MGREGVYINFTLKYEFQGLLAIRIANAYSRPDEISPLHQILIPLLLWLLGPPIGNERGLLMAKERQKKALISL